MNDELMDIKEKKGESGNGDEGIRELIRIEDTIEKMLEAASVDRVYGEPVERGDTVVIPVAEITTGMGLGGGSGSGRKRPADDEEEAAEEGSGGGGGGGGRVNSRPVAIIVAANGSVSVEPVVDKTRVALTAIIANAFIMFLLFLLLRPRLFRD